MKNLITCLVVGALSGATFADVWSVDDDGKADFDNIQAAVDAASYGDEIVVMPGTYTSTTTEVVNMFGKEIWLHSSKGAEVTIIDGEDTRRGILCDTQETSKTVLQGFTITNCYRGDPGGGMYCQGSSPTLINCVFTNNTSVGSFGSGGGMCNDGISSPTLIDCTFENNTALIDGGGMYNNGSSPTLTDCTFRGNTASTRGGGICNYNNSSPILEACTFTDNTAEAGGGMSNYNGSNSTVTDCTFTGNTADNQGGGMLNYKSSPALTDCTFTGNTASSYGGGMVNSFSNPTLTNCRITANTANDEGGGMYNFNGTPTLTNTTVCGNTPDQIGGGGYTDGGGNTVADECPSDVDEDGVDDSIDNCYLYNPDQADCNGNGIGDVCDVADGTSFDCDQNNVPDECQPDCDGDGWIDACDNDADVDGDGIPDNCEEDCNENGLPDDFEIELGIATDCDGNGVPDGCDVVSDPQIDCNQNAIHDACDIADGTSDDCDGNGRPDECDLNDTIQQIAKLLPNDGASGIHFGSRVCISGDTAIVGAQEDDDNGMGSGAAYIYRFYDGQWTEEAKLIASDGEDGDAFGYDVSISGDIVLIGAARDDGNDIRTGSAYVFRHDGKQWIEEAKLIPGDLDYWDHYGSSVSIDGNFAIIGTVNRGTAYLYQFDGIGWESTYVFSKPNIGFGSKVCLNDGVAVIGAGSDDGNDSNSGSAYVYRFDGNNWIETKLLASDGAEYDYFGGSVAVDGDTIVVGARGDGDNGDASGSAYVYRFDGNNWIETKLLASDGASDDYFGYSVAISGETVVVGSHYDDDNGSKSGSAYVYRFDGNVWVETKIIANYGASGDYFGCSVAIDGDTCVIGALGTNSYAGSAYIFSPPLADCNENGIGDICELDDPDNDQNNNGELDDCECVGDADGDEFVNVNDLLIIIGYWGNDIPQADLNFDGIVDVTDLLIVVGNWGPCE